ncbi:MAG TPA: heavy metal-associated domain-containing protein, partial [Actinomycetota bacterium]|nr:heavy metal-associated domain-containing protein [Actinomycetota bacterium]
MTAETKTVVLDTRGLNWATEKNLVEAVLGRRPGVVEVEANPVAQSANVVYDPGRTSIAELRDWVEECGLHCAGQSVPNHICDPMLDEGAPEQHGTSPEGASPHEAMGHSGHGAMSMDDMVKDMRNRFVVAAIFSVPILLWSPIGRDVLGFEVAAP